MSKQYDSEGFMSTPLEGVGARPKDNYHQDSEDNEVRFRDVLRIYQSSESPPSTLRMLNSGSTK